MSEDREVHNSHVSRPQRVAEHAYFKLGTPFVLAGLLGLVVFFLEDMHMDLKEGQQQIQRNVIDIAIAQRDIIDNEEDIQEYSAWLRNLSERVSQYHDRASWSP